MPLRCKLAAIAVLLVVLFSLPLCGTNIITSGSLQVSPAFQTVGLWTLLGNNFSASGDLGVPFWNGLCNYCAVGSVLDFSDRVAGLDFGTGSATVSGQYYPFLNWGTGWGPLPPTLFGIVGPTITLNHGFGTYSGNFYLNGSLCGVTGLEGPCEVFVPRLVGSGTVTFDFAQLPNQPGFGEVQSATYTFTIPYSTPEPTSLLLLGSGALGAMKLLLRKG
jgi:hypothetical protein